MFTCCCTEDQNGTPVELVGHAQASAMDETAPPVGMKSELMATEAAAAEEKKAAEILAAAEEQAAKATKEAEEEEKKRIAEAEEAARLEKENTPAPDPGDSRRLFKDWTITIDKTDEKTGLAVKKKGTALIVQLDGLSGAAKQWNAQNPVSKLISGDMVVKVNGESGEANDIMAALSSSTGKVNITMRRAEQFDVEFTKKGKLGLKLQEDSFRVLAIQAGLINEYNTTCDPLLEIYPGDRIIGIHECFGDPKVLHDALTKLADGDNARLWFRRAV